MATTNIKNSIQSLTGVSSANTDFVENAQRFVVQSTPKNLLRFAMSPSSASTDGSAIAHDRNDSIIDVQRNGYSCREIPFSESVWATDDNSLKKASALYPVWWSQSDGIKIAPATTSSGGAGYVFYIDYLKIDDDVDLRNAVIFHAASSEFSKLATSTVASWSSVNVPVSPSSPDFGGDLSISSQAPVSPSAPDFTYTNASVDDIVKPLISISDKASLSASNPSYSKPVLSLTTTPVIADLSINSIAPASVDSPSFDVGAISVGENLPTYTKPVFNPPTLEAIGTLSLRTAPVPPISPSFTYDNADANDIFHPIVSVSNMASLDTSAPNYVSPIITITTFPTLTWNLPERPIAPTLSSHTVGDFSSQAPSYNAPILSMEDAPSIASLSISAIPPTSPSLSSSTVGTISNSPTFSPPVMKELNYSDADTWINTEEDTEMLQARVSVINSKIQEYQSRVGESVAAFNQENAIYQTNLQVALEDAKLSSQDDAQKIQKYSGEVSKYQNEVNKEVQQYQANFQKDIQLWQIGRQTDIQKFQGDIQSALNSFNEEQALFQATVQKKLKEADLLNSHDTNLLQKFQTELGDFQNATNKVVSSNQAKCACWQQENAVYVQKYNAELQDSVNSFNKDNVAYQEDIQRKVQNLNKDLTVAVENAKNEIAANSANMNKDVQISLQNSVQKLERQVSEYNADLARYNGDVQLYQAEVNASLQKWKAEEWDKKFQTYTLDYNNGLQEYTANIQNALNVFNKEQSSYQLVLQEKIQEAQNQQNKDSSEYAAKIQKYSAEVQTYQADINKEVQKYTINEIQKEIAIWSQNIQADLQSYSSDIQNELNEFNKDVVIYQEDIGRKTENLQKDIQEAMKNADNELQSNSANLQKDIQIALQNAMNNYKEDVDEYASTLQKYSYEIQNYQQKVNTEVQDYVNSLNKKVQEYQSEMALYSAEVQKYQIEVGEQTQENTLKTQNVAYYGKESDRYYQLAVQEIQRYISNNEKMIQQTMAAQAAQG